MSDYFLNLHEIPLNIFPNLFKASYQYPNRRCLFQDIEERFRVLEGMGITTLGMLAEILKTKKRLDYFASRSLFEREYLVVLRREVLSLAPAPVPYARFPILTFSTLDTLHEHRIRNTKICYELWKSLQQEGELEKLLQISEETKNMLCALTDLVRVHRIGPVAAQRFYEVGIMGVDSLAQADTDHITKLLVARNAKNSHSQMNQKSSYVRHCIKAASWLRPGGLQAMIEEFS